MNGEKQKYVVKRPVKKESPAELLAEAGQGIAQMGCGLTGCGCLLFLLLPLLLWIFF